MLFPPQKREREARKRVFCKGAWRTTFHVKQGLKKLRNRGKKHFYVPRETFLRKNLKNSELWAIKVAMFHVKRLKFAFFWEPTSELVGREGLMYDFSVLPHCFLRAFWVFFAGKNAVLRRKAKKLVKMCDLLEKNDWFWSSNAFFKIFARKNRGQWQNSKDTSLWLFCALGAAWGLAFSLPFWAFFFAKKSKGVCCCGAIETL